MNAPAVLELPLDDNLLKVLSSESRREILRLLAERRMTGAELASRLELGKPAVSEHLKKLQESDLIERHDDPDRRWVYYGLSPKGRSILEPQRVRFYLVLAVAALGLMLGMALALGIVAFLQGQDSGLLGPASTSGLQDGYPALGSNLPDLGHSVATPAPGASTSTLTTASTTRAPSRVVGESYVPDAGPVAAAPATVDNQTYRLILPDYSPLPASALNQHNLYVQRVDAANHTIVMNMAVGADLDVIAGFGNETLTLLSSNATVQDSVITLTFSGLGQANSTTAQLTTVAVDEPTAQPNGTAVLENPAESDVAGMNLTETPADVTALENATALATDLGSDSTDLGDTAAPEATNSTVAATANMTSGKPLNLTAVQAVTGGPIRSYTADAAPATKTTTTTMAPSSPTPAPALADSGNASLADAAAASQAVNGRTPAAIAHQVPRDIPFVSLALLLAVAVIVAVVRGRES